MLRKNVLIPIFLVLLGAAAYWFYKNKMNQQEFSKTTIVVFEERLKALSLRKQLVNLPPQSPEYNDLLSETKNLEADANKNESAVTAQILLGNLCQDPNNAAICMELRKGPPGTRDCGGCQYLLLFSTKEFEKSVKVGQRFASYREIQLGEKFELGGISATLEKDATGKVSTVLANF